MTKREITEDQPLPYTCYDGTLIVVSVAGPVEKVYTLTVNGERHLSHRSEELVRTAARNVAEVRNARWNEAMRTADASVTIDQIAPQYIASPLVESERQSSGLARGARLTMPTVAQARVMGIAVKWQTPGYPAYVTRSRRCDLRMLRALARRGWVELDHPIRPLRGDLTDAGRHALAAYERKHGAVTA